MATFGKGVNLQIQKAQDTPKQDFKNNSNSTPGDIIVKFLKMK